MKLAVLLMLSAALFAQSPKVQSSSIQSNGDIINLTISSAARIQTLYLQVGQGSCWIIATANPDSTYSIWNFTADGWRKFDGAPLAGLCTLRSGFGVRQLLSSSPDGPSTSFQFDLVYAPNLNSQSVAVYAVTDTEVAYKEIRK